MKLCRRLYFGITPGAEGWVAFEKFREEWIDPVFEGFTIYQAEGSWMGVNEPSIIMEVIHDQFDINTLAKLQGLGREYAFKFNQDEVWLTTTVVDVQVLKGWDE